jgi:hypothetical protein
MLRTIFRLLAFQISEDELRSLDRRYFIAGLMGTWLVGMGRYWDDPGAKLLQHLGLGSVIYIFALALFIWLVVKPLRIEGWHYFLVVTFIGLTSFPAILYAIPVERFTDIETANKINVWFLAVVAIWRLSLLFMFLIKVTRLNLVYVFTVTLLPIVVIITTLTVLNLHRVVFNIMGGVRNETPHDQSYEILVGLTIISMVLTPLLLIVYANGIYLRRRA